MKKNLTAPTIFVIILPFLFALGIIADAKKSETETIDCGNSVELVINRYSDFGKKKVLYGLRKNGTLILAPCHKMAENEHLKLKVFYGMNRKVQVFNLETGQKELTGYLPAYKVLDAGFHKVDSRQNLYSLWVSYRRQEAPEVISCDTRAVFSMVNGKTNRLK